MAQVSYLVQRFRCCSHRDSLSPTQDFTETTGEESEDQQPHSDHGDSNHRSSFDMLSPAFAEARPPSPSSFSEFEVTRSTHSPASSGPANGVASASSPRAQPQDSAVDLSQDMTAGGLDIIRRALLRSSRARREVKVGNGCSAPTKQSEEKQTEHHTQESSRASQNNMMQKEESAPNKETGLLGYDAQWCWVESQDDVTFVWTYKHSLNVRSLVWWYSPQQLTARYAVRFKMHFDTHCLNEWCSEMNLSLSDYVKCFTIGCMLLDLIFFLFACVFWGIPKESRPKTCCFFFIKYKSIHK